MPSGIPKRPRFAGGSFSLQRRMYAAHAAGPWSQMALVSGVSLLVVRLALRRPKLLRCLRGGLASVEGGVVGSIGCCSLICLLR